MCELGLFLVEKMLKIRKVGLESVAGGK